MQKLRFIRIFISHQVLLNLMVTWLLGYLVTWLLGYLVIAVNTFLLGPFSQHGISGFPSVLSAVYPVGPGTVEINVASGKFLDRGLKYQPAIFKVNGASIRTDLFSRDNGTIIDAIMTGHVHLYQNSTERKLLAIHNHYSKNELKYRLPVDFNYWLERNNAMTLSIKKG